MGEREIFFIAMERERERGRERERERCIEMKLGRKEKGLGKRRVDNERSRLMQERVFEIQSIDSGVPKN